jgi:valyl-tRNA synthetase
MELSKAYNPKEVETRRYAWWHKQGYFKPENQVYLKEGEKPFTITIPPPNVTGTLHMGHALTLAIEDLMTRYHRMKGARTLWVPGTDHAGIATQAIVEKNLEKEGKKRLNMSRSDFLEEVWDWKDKSHKIITEQCMAMGISADWDREAFTMDDHRSNAVITAFKRLYDKGLIYRAYRMVNWDPVQLTGVSDLEVETAEDGEPGHLWTIRYPLETNRWDGPIEDGAHEWGSGRWAEGATEWITVSTTRPETLLGDTAIAVNPEDDRHAVRVACHAYVPCVRRRIPIVADRSVDPAFGTGAVKVTPAHDFNDCDLGQRHHLPFVEVMDERAKMNNEAGPYAGLDRYECRKKLVADLEKEGLLVKVEDYMVRLGRGQRSGAVIEPRMSMQWFCNMQDMAKAATDAVRSGKITIVPERFERTWFHWLDNIRDWCISRQLWWGHQIPVWYVINPATANTTSRENQTAKPTQYCALNSGEAYAAAMADWGPDVTLKQDHDVLDTWFSSGLWPFSTLGWPHDTADMRNYYPNVMLETGYDIIFFWVARMVMMGIELVGDIPFDTIYLHGLIRTADGKKMSKSRPDKIIDPLELIDTYGTDAVRFFLITAGAPGNDIKMDARKEAGKWRSDRMEGARNFANKLWNATRFVLSKLEGSSHSASLHVLNVENVNTQSLSDKWILARLNQTIADARRLNDDYQYGEAGKLIYDFVWSDYCDWYVEMSKLNLNASVLVHVLDASLRLLHPFMPYVTEELWQALRDTLKIDDQAYPSIMLTPYPEADAGILNAQGLALQEMTALQDLIRAIRNVRAEYNVALDKRIPAIISGGKYAPMLHEQSEAIALLARVDEAMLHIATQAANLPEQVVTCALGEITAYLPLSGLVDLIVEKARLQSEHESLSGLIQKSTALLASDFGKRAPANVIEKERTKLADLIAKREQIQGQLAKM